MQNKGGKKHNKSSKKDQAWWIVGITLMVVAAVALVVGIVIWLHPSWIMSDGGEETEEVPADMDPSRSHHGAEKPMIYLYPTAETTVSVRLGNPTKLTTTYPKYNDGWYVLAQPDGTLRNLADNSTREFYGLYWEGSDSPAKIQDDGFVIAGKDTAEFLEEKLSLLGLTDREANEFIVYWLPRLEKNPYNYIRFETTEEINSYMPLSITPKPDTIIRVLMDFAPLDEPIDVTEQILPIVNTRNGFTVVEWGGTEIATSQNVVK